LASVTANTLKSVGELNDQLDVVRRTGFAYEKGESTDGIQCIGTTIVVDGEVLAGISLAVPQFRYTQEREQFFKQLLIDTKRNWNGQSQTIKTNGYTVAGKRNETTGSDHHRRKPCGVHPRQ
jgi:DNA-binding IclR family transcriptional regulator